MTKSTWLIDTSAITRLATSPDRDLWLDRIDRGLVHICTVTLLEAGYSTRSALEHRRLMTTSPLGSMPLDYYTPQIEERALEVQGQLARKGKHRAPSVPDLLLAATAELGRRTILHVDKDFDVIAGVTRQSLERLKLSS